MDSLSEQALLDELYALIRFLYRPALAAKILAAFAESLAAKERVEERLAILRHWLDFYQAHKYRKLMRRRRATDAERMSPCSACGYPVSQRHHLWDIATHGENPVTVQLCPNCHELHHLLYNALARDSAYSRKLVRHILESGKVARPTIERIIGWLQAILAYEVENGWLEPYRLTAEWFAAQIGWPAAQP
jgi:hypothetical protein